MCGICGYISKDKGLQKAKVFKSLLLANESRGNHSTGMYLAGSNRLIKKAIAPTQFVGMLQAKELINEPIAIGHTRYATIGDKTDNNAHPFVFGRVVGTHNGHISNYLDLYPDAKVDSECAFYLLETNNNDYKKVLPMLQGTHNLAWAYNNDGNLYLSVHNNPLSVAFVGDNVYYSSEYHHLLSVVYAVHNRIDDILELDNNKVYIIDKDLNITQVPIDYHDNRYPMFDYGLEDDDYDYMDNYSQYESAYYKEQYQEVIETMGCFYCGTKKAKKGYLSTVDESACCNKCYKLLDDMTQEDYIKVD